MKKDDGKMSFDTCPKCDNLVLFGYNLGQVYKLSNLIIPQEDAQILWEWGVPIYIVRKTGYNVYAEPWFGHNKPNRGFLVQEHQCLRDELAWSYHIGKSRGFEYDRKR